MHRVNNKCIHRNCFIDRRLMVGALKILNATPLPSLVFEWHPYVSLGAGAVRVRACGSATAYRRWLPAVFASSRHYLRCSHQLMTGLSASHHPHAQPLLKYVSHTYHTCWRWHSVLLCICASVKPLFKTADYKNARFRDFIQFRHSLAG